ncbi:MAG: formylglycine-generating enzyme family protein [Candidatus Cloacimonetes bacterium]|nr:formylglycine-generating enzyme family protein [Candidatus Cloacimonadota bacterium]
MTKKRLMLFTIVALLCGFLLSGYARKEPTELDGSTITAPPEGFVLVQGGTFSRPNWDGSYPEPPALVTLSSFYINRYEVTQASYQRVMGGNPSYCNGNPDLPVEQVSWFSAIEYCNRRSLQEGLTPCYNYSSYGTIPDNWPSGWDSDNKNHYKLNCDWDANGYRLPTDMEWMFAARGGNQSPGYTYSGSNTIGEVAWYISNSDNTSHSVGTKAANELGIFDMSGNVWEWCWDIDGIYPSGTQINPQGVTSGPERVRRGGGWASNANVCPVSNLTSSLPTSTYGDLGFRVVRAIP